MQALNITAEGIITTIELDTTQQLDQLQAAVGGYIQYLGLDEALVMVINEEGKIYGLPVNEVATRLTQHYAIGLDPSDLIVGSVVIAGQSSAGDLVDIPASAGEVLERLGFIVNQRG